MSTSDKAAAQTLMQILLRQSAELNSYLLDIQGNCSEIQFKKYKKIVAYVMGSMLLDGINVLAEEFPDLRPPELDDG